MALCFAKYGMDTWYINVIDSMATSTSQLAFLGVRATHILVIEQWAMGHERQAHVLLEVAEVLE